MVEEDLGIKREEIGEDEMKGSKKVDLCTLKLQTGFITTCSIQLTACLVGNGNWW